MKFARPVRMKVTREQLDENGNRKILQNRVCQKYGNSFFFLIPGTKFRFMIGPHWYGVVITLFVIMGGSHMNTRILRKTDAVEDGNKIVYEYYILVCFILTITFLLLTATSDPGIVYNNPTVDEEESLQGLQSIPYCDICSIYQYPKKKIHHCEDCNYCIEGLDHHCPWMVSHNV